MHFLKFAFRDKKYNGGVGQFQFTQNNILGIRLNEHRANMPQRKRITVKCTIFILWLVHMDLHISFND